MGKGSPIFLIVTHGYLIEILGGSYNYYEKEDHLTHCAEYFNNWIFM